MLQHAHPMNTCTLRIHGMVAACLVSAAFLGPIPARAAIPWTTATVAAKGGQTLPVAMRITAANQIYVAGQFSSNPSFSGTTLSSQGGVDLFLAKYSSPGHLQWAVRAGGAQDERMQAMDIDSANIAYITGGFIGTATFDSTDHTSRTVTGNGQTIFLARYSPAGVLDWVITGTSASGGFDFGSGVAVDSATGTLYLAALGQENIVFTSADATTDTVAGVGTWHMVLAKFTTDGVFQWGVTNQAAPNSVPHQITVDKSGAVYVTGWFENTAVFDSRDGDNLTVNGFSPGQSNTDYPDDAFLVKYDPQGNAKWVNHVGGYKAIGNAVAVDLYGQITAVGFIGNSNNGSPSETHTIVTSQPGKPSINLGSGTLTQPYNADEFYATWNAAGQLVRAARSGDAANQASTAIAYSAKGGLNVVGIRQNGSYVSLLWHKYWQKRLLRSKKILNAAQWDPQGQSPVCAVDNAGNLFIAGPFHGTATFGTFHLTSSGPADMYIAGLPPN